MRIALALLLAASFACAHGKDDRTICPEYREQRCLAGQKCALDKVRGCEICQCESPSSTGPDGNPGLPQR